MSRISWNDPTTGERAQFIADTMRESLFDYSFDSNKVPSLNLHYFCDDFLLTNYLVEKGEMKEGNMIPLTDEFESIIKKSIWLPEGITEKMMIFKNNKGASVDISQDKSVDTKKRTRIYLENITYIKALLEADSNYFTLLIDKIEKLLRNTDFSLQEKRELFFCTREFLSELINVGISKTHLYNQVRIKLFSNDINPENDIDYILSFLRSLQPSKKEYNTVFGITENVYSELNELVIGLRSATDTEKALLGTRFVAENSFLAYDPVSALNRAKESFSSVLSVYNSCKHDTNIKTVPKGLVRLKSEEDFKIINESKGLLSKNRNKSRQECKEWLQTSINRPFTSAFISAFELHNSALDIADPQTQLLSLWTIIELLVETKQYQMSKINYISNILCSILCNYYYARRIETLFEQIKRSYGIEQIIAQETKGENHLQKLAIIIKDNNTLCQELLDCLTDYPLEIYAIEELSSLFSSRKALKSDLERHSNRLRWQIMRIYRNRCMIVHSGESFSQLSSLLENEHYYVDELLNYLILKREKGILNTNAVFSLARIKEQEHLQLLNKKDPFDDDDFLSVLFDY